MRMSNAISDVTPKEDISWECSKQKFVYLQPFTYQIGQNLIHLFSFSFSQLQEQTSNGGCGDSNCPYAQET